jgi:hypothetical protein
MGKKNMKKFNKANGFAVMHNCLNLIFKELVIDDLDFSIDNSIPIEQPTSDLLKMLGIQNNQAIVPSSTMKKKPLTPDEENMVNFTSSKTNSSYFKRNSMNVRQGILALKVFDLLFNKMQFKDKHPIYMVRDYVLQEDYKFTLAQSMMLQNEDLTREVLMLLSMHLSDHFSMFQMKDTGLIEFLILSLNSTINGFRAL